MSASYVRPPPVGIVDVIGRVDPTEFVLTTINLERSITWIGYYANEEFFARCAD